eukprot:m.435503 g.435503  ORF g.435503 m.435503 type:complete len:67 (+) comp102867_c0_seq1:324-524(+)
MPKYCTRTRESFTQILFSTFLLFRATEDAAKMLQSDGVVSLLTNKDTGGAHVGGALPNKHEDPAVW